MSKLSDKILLLKVKTKNPEVFAHFYDLYVTKIYRFIYFKVSSHEEAEDLTSEVFLKVWEYIFANKKIDNINSFVYQVARNLVIDYYRKRAQQKLVKDDEEALINLPDQRPSAEAVMQLDMETKSLEKYLRQLKDEYREVIILKYIDELSISEIAKVLDKTNANVRVLSHRALGALKSLTNKDQDNEQ